MVVVTQAVADCYLRSVNCESWMFDFDRSTDYGNCLYDGSVGGYNTISDYSMILVNGKPCKNIKRLTKNFQLKFFFYFLVMWNIFVKEDYFQVPFSLVDEFNYILK